MGLTKNLVASLAEQENLHYVLNPTFIDSTYLIQHSLIQQLDFLVQYTGNNFILKFWAVSVQVQLSIKYDRFDFLTNLISWKASSLSYDLIGDDAFNLT